MKIILLVLAVNIFGLMAAQNTNYVKSIDSLMGSFTQNNAFSGSILIQKDGETVYKGEFNKFGDYSNKYRVGSITKVFTAVITFQLIEEGKLNLDTKLSKYYPNVKNAEKITIGHLLNHTSGIYNYLEWNDYYISKKKKFTKEEMLDLITSGKPDFKAGEDCRYSNSNYLLLGYIIEDVTRKSYAENLKLRIVDKIELKDTYCETEETEYPERTASYSFDGEKWTKETETHPTFTFAAGAVISTTEDLSKLMDNLLKGKLILGTSLSQMGETNQKGIGYGLFMTPFYDKMGYGHSGNIDEFHSFTGYFPNDRLSISILSNGGNIALNEVVMGVACKYFGRPYKNPDFTIYEGKTSSLTKIYSGVYKAKLVGLIDVGTFQISEAANNYLFLSMYEDGKDGQKVLLERKGENKFYARKNNAQFDFIVDKKGNVTGMKLTQNKQSINCKKIK